MKEEIYIPDVFDILWARRADTFEEYLERLKQLKTKRNNRTVYEYGRKI